MITMTDALLLPGWAMPAEWYRTTYAERWPGLMVLDPGFFGGMESFAPSRYEQRVKAEARSVIMAHSLGSMFALQAAAGNPSVKALILGSPFARFSATSDYCGRAVRDIRAMQIQLRREPQKLLDNFINTVYRPELCSLAVAEELDEKALASGLQCLLDYDVRTLLPQVRCPVLVLQGAEDAISGDGQAAYLAERLPLAELQVIAGSGHGLLLTQPDRCIELIKIFIDSRKAI